MYLQTDRRVLYMTTSTTEMQATSESLKFAHNRMNS